MLLINLAPIWNEKKCKNIFKLLIKRNIKKVQPVFKLLYSQKEWDQRVPQNNNESKRN